MGLSASCELLLTELLRSSLGSDYLSLHLSLYLPIESLGSLPLARKVLGDLLLLPLEALYLCGTCGLFLLELALLLLSHG